MSKDLESLRAEIADIDAGIAELIDRRLKAAEQVALAKEEQGLPIVNPKAEERVYARYAEAAERYGIRPETMRALAELLISEAVFREEEIIRRP